jgi:hypothetical protein
MSNAAEKIDMRSTEYLEFVVANDAHILYERGAPAGRLKRDFISIRGPNGGNIGLQARGFVGSALELPRAIFDDFAGQSFIRQDGPQDDEGRIVYRLTIDGRRAGHTPATALAEIAQYVHENCGSFASDGPRLPDQREREDKEHRIRAHSGELMGLSVRAGHGVVTYAEFDAVLKQLHQEGFSPPAHLVSYVAYAIQRR